MNSRYNIKRLTNAALVQLNNMLSLHRSPRDYKNIAFTASGFRRHAVMLFTGILLSASSGAQNFTASLSGNPISTTGWTFPSGISFVSGNSFVLTNATTNQAGYIYYNTPANLSSCADFTVSFEFQITNNSFPPADGLTFFYITNPPTGFTTGSGLGMPLNPDGLVVLFDTYDNNSTPDNPLIALAAFSNGQNYLEGNSTGILGNVVNNQNNLTDGNWHTSTISYNAGNITVTLDAVNIITAFHPLNQTGYFGFSASTGALWSKHSVRNITISGTLPPAAPTVVTPVVYCQGDPASPLTATGTAALNWYTTPTGGSPLPGAPTPNTSVANTNTWYVSVQGVNSCESARTAITAIVNAKPGPPLGTLNFTYCDGDTVVPFNFNGQDLQWYSDATGGTPSSAPPVISTAAPMDSNWYVSQTVNGCESDRAHVHVTVASKPLPPAVTTPLVYCAGDNAGTLVATGQNLRWYNTPTGGFSSVIAPLPATGIVGTESWYVTQTIDGCQSDRSQIDVSTNLTPNALIVPQSSSVCVHETLNFNYFGNAPASANYIWNFPLGSTVLSGSGQGPFVVRFDSVGIKQVTLLVDNQGCKSPLTAQNINVRPIPEISFTSRDEACIDEVVNVALTHFTVGIDHFVWSFDGAEVVYGATEQGPYGVKWNSPGLYKISVKGLSDVCPSDTYTDSIRIYPLPVAGISGISSGDVCTGDTVTLSTPFGVGYQYQWSPVPFFLSNGTSSAKATIDFTGYVSVITTDMHNCRASDSVLITTTPCCELNMPSAFSPNGDAKNDFFRVITVGHHDLKNFRVMNRWGQTIFETSDETKGWDGTFNQQPQDMGTYFYYVKYKCSNGLFYEKKGEVVLIR